MFALSRRPLAAIVLVLAVPLLSACVSPGTDLARQKIATAEECLVGKCRFNNAPLELEPETIRIEGRSYDFNRLAKPLEFVDGTGTDWVAPETTLTDGASIPQLFVPLIGFPREPVFANAAALHDAYCGIGNEDGAVYHAKTWQEVHRLFYDALVASGTSPLKSKIMFAAVWLGGPRWHEDGRTDSTLAAVPASLKQAAMLKARAYVQDKNPDFPTLVDFLIVLEQEMLDKTKALPSSNPNNDLTAGI